jgi:hypothetical protein
MLQRQFRHLKVVSLTTAKYKPHTFSVSDFALSYTTNKRRATDVYIYTVTESGAYLGARFPDNKFATILNKI